MGAPIQVTVRGLTFESIAKACKYYGQNYGRVEYRFNDKGMSIEDALFSKNMHNGKCKHPLYTHWNSMVSRCRPSNQSRARYKDKGISVCDEWASDFWKFAEDMGRKPGKGYTIDRIDNSKGYFKDNCRWATVLEQGDNQDSNHRIKAFGENLILSEWSRRSGFDCHTIAHRIKKGMPPEEALTKMTRLGRMSKL